MFGVSGHKSDGLICIYLCNKERMWYRWHAIVSGPVYITTNQGVGFDIKPAHSYPLHIVNAIKNFLLTLFCKTTKDIFPNFRM